VAEENVHIHGEMDDEISHALNKTRDAAMEADAALGQLGRGATKAGTEMDRGMSKAKRSTDRARDAAGRFIPVAHGAGTAAEKAGAKAAIGSKGFDQWTRKVNKAARSVGGLSAMMMVIKWGTLLTGGVAVVGMLSALAAGAVMAVGALSPMVGVVGALGPGLALMAATMGVMKISGEDVKALFVPLGNEFKAMRYEITQGLVPGIQQFSTLVKNGLLPTIKSGLVGYSSALGDAAVKFGSLISSQRNARIIGVIFNGLRPIVLLLADAAGRLFGVFLNLTEAALPMVTDMAQGFDNVAMKLERWSTAMTDSGRAQAWMSRSWNLMKSAGRTLRDVLVGLYNIFRLAGQVAREEFAGGMGAGAARFRAWTESAEGTTRILKFFHDSAPVLRETGKILATIGRGLGSFSDQPGLANLLKQINDQLLPAIGHFLSNFTSESGLGPALVGMFSSLFDVLSNIPLSGLTDLVKAIGGLLEGIKWLIDNVPGLGPAIGIFLTLWTIAGAALKVTGMGMKAFKWITDAAAGTKDLSLAQKGLKLVLKGAPGWLGAAADALYAFGVATWAALGPVGIIILAIIALVALFIWAYNKFDWFHDAVDKVAHVIADVFIWLGKAIAQPFIDLWNIVKATYNFLANAWNSIPPISVPDWVPLIGGKTFNLPKLPTLAEGGVIQYRSAIVGEQGPEAIVKDGRFMGMVGLGGPELRTDLPVGGYVVPNPATLAGRSSLGIPDSVADAVSGVLPNYAALFGRSAAPETVVNVDVDSGSDQVVEAIDRLAAAMARSRPTPAPQPDIEGLLRAVTNRERRDGIARRYTYAASGRL